MRRCEDYTREKKSEFMMECPKDRDDGCLTVFQGMYCARRDRIPLEMWVGSRVFSLKPLSIVSLTRCMKLSSLSITHFLH